jgi:hypothetical protein
MRPFSKTLQIPRKSRPTSNDAQGHFVGTAGAARSPLSTWWLIVAQIKRALCCRLFQLLADSTDKKEVAWQDCHSHQPDFSRDYFFVAAAVPGGSLK